jgi:predicted ATP-dependent endonuclease of OLD family
MRARWWRQGSDGQDEQLGKICFELCSGTYGLAKGGSIASRLMRLVSVEVEGFRRFARKARMSLDGRVIAVVGPNEAGKTSFLRAMAHLNGRGEFDPADFARSRAEQPSSIVTARFLIEDDDRRALGSSADLGEARWYVRWKVPDGTMYHRLDPASALRRDRKPRRALLAMLQRAQDHSIFAEAAEDSSEAAVVSMLVASSEALAVDDEDLDADVVENLYGLAGALEDLSWPRRTPKYLSSLHQSVRRLAIAEREPPLANQFLEVLDSRYPRFLLFGAPERDLRSDYELTEIVEDPPIALVNLARLAHLDLVALHNAKVEERHADAEKLLEDANKRLHSVFADAWRQSGVYLRLSTDGTLLRVFVSAEAQQGYTSVAERSEGLRAFIALLTFCALHDGKRPIVLLVDEAEIHLHYDAQADLVRVFTRQQAAEKVIYTTHSAGCLPHDLSGVRLVEPLDDGDSQVTNAFWSGGPGFSPLLIGMGASVLAFTPARRAVLAEGGCDFVLLPALLKEASGNAELDFQILPGLAEIPANDVGYLELEAAAVAYLVDGNGAGKRIRNKLLRGGISAERIVTLGGDDSGLVLEDVLDVDSYVTAVNRALHRSHGEQHAVTAASLGDRNRPGELAKWCRRRGIAEPNKTAVAYEVLELRSEGRQLLAEDRRAVAEALHEDLTALLERPR